MRRSHCSLTGMERSDFLIRRDPPLSPMRGGDKGSCGRETELGLQSAEWSIVMTGTAPRADVRTDRTSHTFSSLTPTRANQGLIKRGSNRGESLGRRGQSTHPSLPVERTWAREGMKATPVTDLQMMCGKGRLTRSPDLRRLRGRERGSWPIALTAWQIVCTWRSRGPARTSHIITRPSRDPEANTSVAPQKG
jgi:hypothetical protein